MKEPRDSSVWGGPTRWSLLLEDPRSSDTWRYLVDRYRGPVMAWVLRRLPGHPQAEEVAVDFFTYLYTKELVSRADRTRGKFRAFLQGVLRHYLHERQRADRRARGVDLEGVDVETSATPEVEQVEELLWARRVLHNACKELATTHPRNAELILRYYGVRPHESASPGQLCTDTGLTSNALFKALHDGRKELGRLIRQEVLETVSDPTAFEEEWDLVRSRLQQTHGALMHDVESEV